MNGRRGALHRRSQPERHHRGRAHQRQRISVLVGGEQARSGRPAWRSRWSSHTATAKPAGMASAHSVHASPAGHHDGHAGRPPAVTATILDPWTPSDSGHRPGIGAYAPVWPDSVPIALRTTHPNHQAFVRQARNCQLTRTGGRRAAQSGSRMRVPFQDLLDQPLRLDNPGRSDRQAQSSTSRHRSRW